MYGNKKISFFLNCGFLPDIDKNALSTFFDIHSSKFNNKAQTIPEPHLIEEGIHAFKNSYKKVDGNKHIVPLSGGLDSRAILAGLIDAGLKKKITTVTFGTPGTYDYEIANTIAKELRLNHKSFDLRKIEVTTDALLKTAKNGGAWTFLFDAYYNTLIYKEFGHKCTYWSGFVGDVVAGSHLPYHESCSWKNAKKHFWNYNQIQHPINLSHPDNNIEDCLPTSPLAMQSTISFDDQLDFSIRQQNYTKRVNLLEGYNIATPFLDRKWVEFMFNLPQKQRFNKYLYKKILLNGYPDLFSIATTNNLGGSLRIRRYELYCRKILNRLQKYSTKKTNLLAPIFNSLSIYRQCNYINFSDAIRHRNDYNYLVTCNIQDLKKRQIVPWLNLDLILHDHLTQKNDYGSALILLTALEISLKAAE